MADVFLLPILLYSLWQAAYLLCTEVLLFHKMEEDPQLITSMRYLATDKKNGMYILVTKVARSIGVFAKDEVFNPKTMKTKVIFVVAQVLFTLVTVLPTPFLYSSYSFSCCYIFVIFGLCIWRGGSYYIEVFSERYKLKFVEIEREIEKQDSVNSENGDSDEDQKLFNQIVDAINGANENDCISETFEEEKVIDIQEFEREDNKSNTEVGDNTQDSDKSWKN
eukprot:TRINITY_DN38778_c0_g1_i1.p1 TRINITY_DN38778_c0_g1~~TRINITY_DN38778_c0_g1_i1.p1  ORF type:complete len:246 (-),score=64.68 TRINITY_DN38778_c0_g1_i1:130-795(-)